MAKPARRRERRAAPSSASAQHRKAPGASADQDLLGDSASDRRLILIFVVFFVLSPAVAVLVYRLKYAPGTEAPSSAARGGGGGGFVKTDATYQEVLAVSTALRGGKSFHLSC